MDALRLAFALGIFVFMLVWEFLSPKRKQHTSCKKRWPTNLELGCFNMVFMNFTIANIAYASAVNAVNQSWGILNQITLSGLWTGIFSLLFLDLAIYCQHIFMHKNKVLWRLHKIHHTDIELDVSTAIRFHPVEILISMLYKVVCIYMLGASPIAVVVFEITLNGVTMFNHSNINIPERMDRFLRWVVVTPDMHRIHHSIIRCETDSNYGFFISFWDRLFKTYVAEPNKTQASLEIGLPDYRKPASLNFIRLLVLPFQAVSQKK